MVVGAGSGLARVIRGHADAALENVALWHERDISHSSAERLIFPGRDGPARLHARRPDMGGRRARVFPDRMRENLDVARGHRRSQSVLLALVGAGLSRDDAYRIVQRRRGGGVGRGRGFRDALNADSEVARLLDDAALDGLFDPGRFLREPVADVRAAREAPRASRSRPP